MYIDVILFSEGIYLYKFFGFIIFLREKGHPRNLMFFVHDMTMDWSYYDSALLVRVVRECRQGRSLAAAGFSPYLKNINKDLYTSRDFFVIIEKRLLFPS